MPKRLDIVCLLLAYFHLGLQSMESGGTEKRDVPKNYTSCSVPSNKLHISSPSSKIAIGADVAVVCSSEIGCLPIDYILFLNKTRIRSAVENKKDKIVTFKFTINSMDELGEYKCRAQHRFTNMSKYSPGLYFTLREAEINLAVLIVLPLLLLLVLIGIALAIPWLILPWCKARKLRTASVSVGFVTTNCPHSKNSPTTSYPHSENCPTYDDIEYRKNEETEYCNVNISNKDNYRNVFISEDSTTNYAEVIIRS